MPNPVTIKFNKASIDKKIMGSKAMQKKGLNAAQIKIERALREEKRRLLKEFDNHPVTQEIESGPFAENSSGALGGYGNLFSFIGFDYGENPTQAIREILAQNIYLQPGRITTRGWSFRVKLPTKAEISKASPVPWEAGSSWVYGVEEASIAGLKYYVVERGRGHSLGGYQDEETVNNLTMKRTSYLTKILENFSENLRRLDR